MKHPKVRINLADVFKSENHKPLAVGDKVTERYGEEEYRDVHCIYGQVNTRTIYVRNEQSPLLWGRTVEARNRESLTEDEAQRLLCADNKELLKSWHRLNPDGSKTPLADIYAERVEVGVGSWLLDDDGCVFCISEFYSPDDDTRRMQSALKVVAMWMWEPRPGTPSIPGRSRVVTDRDDMTRADLNAILPDKLSVYTLLPLADALELLGEMEEGR